jgi:hypothetical protein
LRFYLESHLLLVSVRFNSDCFPVVLLLVARRGVVRRLRVEC